MRKIDEIEKYIKMFPRVSPILIFKISMTKYGTIFSKRALERLQERDLRFTKAEPFGISLEIRKENFYTPGAVIFRDGSSVLVNFGEPYANPYFIDYDEVNDSFFVCESAEDKQVVDTVSFVPRPAFFDKETSRGIGMDRIGGTCSGQRLLINAFQRCRFWEEGNQCHYCALFSAGTVIDGKVNLDDISETVEEALKEPGRFTEISVSGGSDFGGNPPFSDEIERYINVLHAVAKGSSDKMEVQLMAPAYKKEDIKRIYDETCLTSYRPNIEIWEEDLWKILCPGKEKWVGRGEWLKRTCDAVEIFGKGRVYTQMVCGAELAKPTGFDSVIKAIDSAIEGCEFFAKHGVNCHVEMWRPHRKEKLGWQETPDMEYYVRLAEAFYDIRKDYGLTSIDEDHMRGSDNPDMDLERGEKCEDIKVTNQVLPIADLSWHFENQKAELEEGATVLLKLNEHEAFDISHIVKEKDGNILVLLDSDRDELSNILTRKLWYREPAELIVWGKSTHTKLTTIIYKNEIVGGNFAREISTFRENNPGKDLISVCKLRTKKQEKLSEKPHLQLRENKAFYCRKHLDI